MWSWKVFLVRKFCCNMFLKINEFCHYQKENGCQYPKCIFFLSRTISGILMKPGSLRWEYILCIAMRVVKGDWYWEVTRNNRKKSLPHVGAGVGTLRTLQNVYGVGTRPYVQLLQSTCTSMCRHMIVTLSNKLYTHKCSIDKTCMVP